MTIKDIRIKNRMIGEKYPIFLIAEAGVNHNGRLEIAIKMIDIAANAKCDAIKFQTFNADKLMLKSTSKVEYQKASKNDKENFYEMIKRLTLKKDDFSILKNYCEKKEIIFLSTPFDEDSVDLLEDLNVSAYKIGSGDLNNFPLLKKVCLKGKPILLSTGMANLSEVSESVNFVKSNNIKDLVIFQCTTNYPASLEEINLNVIDTYKKEFPDDFIGFSDHSLGIEASIGAAAKGIRAVEKHFTLDKNMEGPDHKASLDPMELEVWVKKIRNLEKSLGSYDKKPSKYEIEIAKIARKSIVSLTDLDKGSIIREDFIAIKRPGEGIEPKYFDELLGRKIKRKVKKDSLIRWEDLE